VPTSAGQVYAFGGNFYGQLGNLTNNGTESANPAPTIVSLPGASGPVAQVAAGEVHSLALTSTGQLYAFGDNAYGQLGSTTNSGSGNANPTPTIVNLPGASGPVTQIAAGGWYSLALTSTGQLFAFGENAYGQLGNATNNGSGTANPTPTIVNLPGASGPVTQIAAGANHSLAVTATGQLFAFGENGYGQLGNTTNIAAIGGADPTPTIVSLPGASGPVTQVAAGVRDSLALTSTGQMYAFGDNQYGELGNTAFNGFESADPTPTIVSIPGASGPVTQIAAGAYFNLALTSTGQLFAFGENYFGELGNTANNGTGTANPTPMIVSLPGADGPVIQIAAGEIDSLAVTATGQLYTFGENKYGQLGSAIDNGNESANPTPMLVSQPEGNTIDTVGRGSDAFQTLEVVANLAVLDGSLPSGQVAVPYSASGQAAGGVTPYKWSASGLSPGLSIDPATGQISGTPTASGSADVVLTVTDADGISAASAALALTIAAPPTVLPSKASQRATSVHPFEMYFEGTRRGRRLRLTSIVIISLSPGERVSYTCEKCAGRKRSATKSARHSKLTFATNGLIVTSHSRLKITVTAKDGSRRVRTYGFTFGHNPHAVLKGQQCFLADEQKAISCQA
jgi:alpha-tubulin suppressor-like RCC1 family protein